MFTIRQFEARTLIWWADQQENIDFEPPYQRRGGLWSLQDKAFLIDSILNGYDIPKIYLADFTLAPSSLNTKSKQYAVIDGKQRFEAILEFLEGGVVLLNAFSFADDPSLKLAGLSYRDLRANFPKVASRFDNYNLTVMSVVTNEEGKINELFVRLNRNKTLTGPEIRNAMRGIVPGLIRDLSQNDFFIRQVRFRTQRGQDLDAAGKLLLVEFRSDLVETKKAMLDRFVREGESLDAELADANVSEFERAATRVEKTLSAMNEIFVPKDELLASQGVIVPYYWLVRSVPARDRTRIRPFLVNFEATRRKNRKIADNPKTAKNADQDLLLYDRMNRSINDARSLEMRYGILFSRFKGRNG